MLKLLDLNVRAIQFIDVRLLLGSLVNGCLDEFRKEFAKWKPDHHPFRAVCEQAKLALDGRRWLEAGCRGAVSLVWMSAALQARGDFLKVRLDGAEQRLLDALEMAERHRQDETAIAEYRWAVQALRALQHEYDAQSDCLRSRSWSGLLGVAA